MDAEKIKHVQIQIQPGLDLQRIDVTEKFLQLIHPFRILVNEQ